MMSTARILIVDDDDHVRDALVDELSPTYTVEAVGSGTEALDALATQQYDVIISDLKMPDHDGIEVLEFARDHQRDAVRVLLTGYLDERAQRALLSPDAPYKVGKPWHDEIEVVVRRALEQRDVARRLTASVVDALSMSRFDAEGDLRLRARGTGESAHQLVSYMAHRAQRRNGVREARVSSVSTGTQGNRMG